MFRKFILAAAAIAAIGTVSLTAGSTPASAKHWGHHHFHGHGLYFGGGYGYRVGYYDSCIRTRWVVNRFGELVLRRVNVCY